MRTGEARSTVPRLYVATEAEAERIEGEIRSEHDRLTRWLAHRSRSKLPMLRDVAHNYCLDRQVWGQKLSRYVFAKTSKKLVARALEFAISIGISNELQHPVVAKIVTSRIKQDPWLYGRTALRKFFEDCLQQLIQWEYLGWDMDGWAYTPERWGVARRVLQCIYFAKDVSFLDLVRNIRDRFISGEVTLNYGGDEFTHAEVVCVLEFVVKGLETAKKSKMTER